MKTFFFFYPHCYLKSTDKEILVYDTLNKRYVYQKEYPLLQCEKKSIQRGFLIVSDKHNVFLNRCLTKDLGYYLDFENVVPFMYNRNIEFVTSLDKERKSLGYNLQSYTNSLLRDVTILLNNGKKELTEEECLQMEYPIYNNASIDVDYLLKQLSSFQFIETIILSGELKKSLLCNLLEYAQNHNVHVICRILYDSVVNTTALELLDKYSNLSIELLVDRQSEIVQIKSILKDRIHVKAIIKTIHDLEWLKELEDILYLPVFSSKCVNTDILMQMILSEDEILHSTNTIKDCLLSDCINESIYGHLTIDYDGSVFCLGNRIASIYENDLASLVNHWIGEDDCIWYETRKKKDRCRDCALQSLCPPISIYEKMGIYKCPCEI